ncbi:hypothetical protein [Francisella sp. LA112445]|uniref:hypothetical protein n=1 Tax=Francisella sp. LA112445 TaxID=1395624 RepID=UPI001788A57C|nr:hypothetical protein [Francisella sp. LA112445]QIW10733.1 hypothetical protein FIP56_08465 [Francisella sp. LA112445]
MTRLSKALKIILTTLILCSSVYAANNQNINSQKSVDSIIKSLQEQVSNLQIEADKISKQDNKKQQPSFVMYNNVVVHHNSNENQYIN